MIGDVDPQPLSIPEREPLITAAWIVSGVDAAIVLLVVFGLPITDAQAAAIVGLVAIISVPVLGYAARQYVTPNGKVLEYRADTGEILAGEATPLPPRNESDL